jgi:peroxiredoxin Q/BCP
VVLYFFPAAFTPGCTIEARLFAEATDEFAKQGATVVGVTAGNIDRVAEFSKVECRDKFAVAADPGAAVAKKYDALLAARPEWSSRTSYVIGKDGKIIEAYSDMNPNKHVEMTMAAVKGAKG